MQEIFISLDGRETPLKIIEPMGQEVKMLLTEDDKIEMRLIDSATIQGKHSVILLAKVKDTKDAIVAMELTANNMLSMAGAVRGRLRALGIISDTVNPPMAFGPHVVEGKAVISFSTELPLQSFVYSLDEAKKFWRELRRMCDEAERMLARGT